MKNIRQFSVWAGEQLEIVCARNDEPRPGKELKPAWEITPPHILREKINEEFLEVIIAFFRLFFFGKRKNRDHLQWELADLAATAMMLSARIDPEMSKLRRGKNADNRSEF